MGNVSGSRRDGAGPSGVNKCEGSEQHMDFEEQSMAHDYYHTPGGVIPNRAFDGYHAPGVSQETMVLHPPYSPVTFLSPLTFTSQAPMVPLQRPDKVTQTKSNELMQNKIDYGDEICKQKLPAMITWTHEGKQVAVEGSWDNWTMQEPLQRSGDNFIIVKMLSSGVYHYQFIVDGERVCASDLPWTRDVTGCIYNILDLQDYTPDAVETRSEFEPPPSPDSSYDNSLDDSFYAKDAPILPPQSHKTVLNVHPSFIDQSLPRPQHAVLNHLYVKEMTGNPSVVALGSTVRFEGKFVTIELYKPSRKQKNENNTRWS